MMDFGSRFRAIRESRGVSQAEIAKHLGVNPATISHYQSNTSYPSVDILIKITQYLNVSADYLLCLSNEPDFDFPDLTEGQKANVMETVRQYQILNSQIRMLQTKE